MLKKNKISANYICVLYTVKYTNYFEDDFYYLKKIFKNRRVNIIDVGASDGISSKFFFKQFMLIKFFVLNPKKLSADLNNLKKKL